jgi:uncharacterized LabA/DUF88 family protein
MNECLILVDNSNVFIEGQRYSAKQRGLAEEFDVDWRIDFSLLLQEVANGHSIIRAVLVGSFVPPPDDPVWAMAARQHFEVIAKERYAGAGEKEVDTELTVQGTALIATHPRPAVLKLLSGDRDFMPLIQFARSAGWENELWTFSSGMSQKLNLACHRTKLLDRVFEKIGRYNDM